MTDGVHRFSHSANIARHARRGLVLNRQHSLDLVALIGALGSTLSGLTPVPTPPPKPDVEADPLRQSIHKWLNWPNREASPVAGESVLQSEASQRRCRRGKINTYRRCLEDLLQFLKQRQRELRKWKTYGLPSLHHGGVTRSGTLVGPGTKKKWRPAMTYPPLFVGSHYNNTIGSSATASCAQDFPF
jgi:hypothetical protein